jgi:Fe-S-cluster containining protein
LNEINGVLKGPTLTKNEVKLFPRDIVSPSFGRGKNASNIYAITRWQINVNVCPFLMQNNECKIYEKRPLTCRRFPLMSLDIMRTRIAYAKGCSFVDKIEKELGYELDYLFSPDTFIAKESWEALRTEIRLMELNNFDAESQGMDIFTYNLKTKQWEQV